MRVDSGEGIRAKRQEAGAEAARVLALDAGLHTGALSPGSRCDQPENPRGSPWISGDAPKGVARPLQEASLTPQASHLWESGTLANTAGWQILLPFSP